MRYEEKLDLTYNNTMTIFLGEIKKNSVILEFGPASGRLTKYLKEEYGCKVYIVEIDEEAGEEASKYAEKALVGVERGNIESYQWVGEFSDVKFDYILFADVLEHLHDQEKVLENAKKMLSADGYILVSLPNIAHNSVIIDLLKNQFNYSKTGLLDDTHLKFWTYDSIEALFKKTGLNVDVRYATYSQVGFNEFNNKYADCTKNMEFELKTRDMAEIYQFVYKVSENANCRNLNKIRRKTDYYYAQFLDKVSEDFDIENAERDTLLFESMRYVKEHRFEKGCSVVRFDPINKNNCCIKINSIELKKGGDRKCAKYRTNAVCQLEGTIYYFDNNDPQVIIDVDDDYEYVVVDIEYISVSDDRYNGIFEIVAKTDKANHDIIDQKENYIKEQREILSDRDNKIRELNGVIEQKENYIGEQRNTIANKENDIKKLKDVVVQKENYIVEQRESKENIIKEKNQFIDELYAIIQQQDAMILNRGAVIRDMSGRKHLQMAIGKAKQRLKRKKSTLKIGILNPYLPTLGGGEKHMGYLCQFLEEYYHFKADIDIIVFNYNDINVFSPDYITIDDVNKQFGLKLKKTCIRKLDLSVPSVAIETVEQRQVVEQVSSTYDIFVNFMFQSKHIGRAKINIYEVMFPPKRMEPMPVIYPAYRSIEEHHDQEFADSYQLYISNSEYTNHWLEAMWQIGDRKTIIYPPVFAEKDIVGKYQESKKENIIMSVGRFFVGAHSKKQLDLVKFFVNHQEIFKNYEYHLAGAVATYQEDVEYLNQIKELASTVDNVFIHENCPFDELMDLYSRAKIFWHGTGYGVNENEQPEKMEHFGITPVEAMSYGVIPVVINKGGPKETVVDGEIGYCWNTEDECVAKTKLLIDDDELRRQMAVKAAERANEYSIEKFYERHRRVFDGLQI